MSPTTLPVQQPDDDDDRERGTAADFTRWTSYLPPPLSPMVMRGTPLNQADRIRAGFSEAFLKALEQWSPKAPGF